MRVKETTHYQDAALLAELSADLGEPMVGININTLAADELLQTRGN